MKEKEKKIRNAAYDYCRYFVAITTEVTQVVNRSKLREVKRSNRFAQDDTLSLKTHP